ncbi:ABC transporter ATP-binding protein [Sediminibacillus albus]|nr:ATP-binding cassette domain-containing protein [Sediminibacillus albus]
MSESILEIKDVSKAISKKQIIHNVSLEVKPGEVVGLLGPNGAGKTTILKMIVGFYSVGEGEIYIDGINIASNKEKCLEKIGAIIESPDLYDNMTGLGNLKFCARFYSHVNSSRIQEAVELVGLTKSINQKVKTYSLGMKQRLGIAQAILHEPKLLILDEPTNGLDPEGIYELRNYIHTLTRKGISVLISSHLLSEMQIICDRVAIIQEGKLIDIIKVTTISDLDLSINKVTYQLWDKDSAEKAKKILREHNMKIHINDRDKLITIEINHLSEILKLNNLFHKVKIQFIQVSIQKENLEEKFMDIVKNKAGIQ